MAAPSSLCSPRLRPSITSLPQGLQYEAKIKPEINVATISPPLPPPLPTSDSPTGKLTPSPGNAAQGLSSEEPCPQLPPFY